MKIGIDFGTTNSAVAVLPSSRAEPRILQLAPGENTQRTVIFAPDGPDSVQFGNAAFAAYLAADMQGRFLRSIKTFLGDDVPSTSLGGGKVEFTFLVGAYLRFLVQKAERVLGQRITDVVVGRPVVFSNDPVRNERAINRLNSAIELAELPQHRFQLEPIAAAFAHERRLKRDRTVLVGDFGGGTADFAVLRIGPGHRDSEDRSRDVLATGGVSRAGDALDARFMTGFLLRYFGANAEYRDKNGAVRYWDPDILREVVRLYDIHRHRSWKLERDLSIMEDRVADPLVVRRLRKLVFDDLGYPLAWAIEASKRRLSTTESTTFVFDEFNSEKLIIEREIRLDEFAEGSAEILEMYRAAIRKVLADAGVSVAEVDEVFLTGGTSQLPFVRGIFATLFGEDKLRSADAFTSVCEGLALS